MNGRRLAAVVLLACVALGAPAGAQAGAFPLAITALLLSKDPTVKVRHAFGAHALAVALGAVTRNLTLLVVPGSPPAAAEIVIWALGCLLLLGVQTGRFRHPPALATGGAALAGFSPSVLMGQLGLAVAACVLCKPQAAAPVQGDSNDI